MNRVLLITIVFPPEGGGGTIRVEKNAKYLPHFGWNLSVITTKHPKGFIPKVAEPGLRVYRAPRCDITNLLVGTTRRITNLVCIIRKIRLSLTIATNTACRTAADGSPPPRRRLAEYIFIPDDRILWVPLGIVFGLLAVMRDRPSVIYSTSPSPSTHLVGYCLAILTGLPWVIEFRDPWMLNPFRITRPFSWMEALETRIEEKVLHKAQHVVVTSEEYRRDFLCRYPRISPRCISYIPNGFDPEDFEGITPKSFNIFTIVHCGTFYEARSSVPFLNGVALAIEKDPSIKGNFQVIFVGQHDCVTESAIDRLALQEVVFQVGNVIHRESIEYLAGAEALLLIPGPGDGTMPGKTYEYLAARKPILALAGEGTVSDLVSSTNTGIVVSPDDVPAIADAILSIYNERSSDPIHNTCIKIDDNLLKQFDRREIASRTAILLNDLVVKSDIT